MKLPSFEDCLEIVKNNTSFIHKTVEFRGYKIHMFNYLLAQYKDFECPIENSELQAFELRGLTFVEHNGLYSRYLMLHKFFNINQCKGYLYDDLKDLEITSIDDKRDGSMIRFIRLPNGDIVAKTKMDLDNEQTKLANNLLSADKELYSFVSESLDSGLSAIFELTSSLNRIVLAYKETKLTLIKLRDEKTGHYLDFRHNDLVKKYKISLVDACDLSKSLDFYLKEKDTIKGIEGWVFSSLKKDGSSILYKVKTVDYCEKHHLMTDTFQRENLLMSIILEDKLDDVLGQLDQDDERRNILINIGDVVSSYVNEKVQNSFLYIKEHYKGDKKDFAINHKKHPDFHIISRAISISNDGDMKDKIYKDYVAFLKTKTYRLENARAFLIDECNIRVLDYFIPSEV